MSSEKRNQNGDTTALPQTWIKKRLKQIGLKQVDLAAALDLDRSRVSEIIAGKRKAQLHEIRIISRILRLPVNEVLSRFVSEAGDVAPDPDTVTIAVKGTVQAGNWQEAIEWPIDEWEYVTVPKINNSENLYGLRICGDSMNRHYPHGSILICTAYRDYTQPIGDGDHVIVERIDRAGLSEATVKELAITDDGRIWLMPKSDNPEHQTPLEIQKPANTADYYGEPAIKITGVVIGSYKIREKSPSNGNRRLLPLK